MVFLRYASLVILDNEEERAILTLRGTLTMLYYFDYTICAACTCVYHTVHWARLKMNLLKKEYEVAVKAIDEVCWVIT